MSEHKIYAEAHRTIASIINYMDMDEYPDIVGNNSAKKPSEEVIDAMYCIAHSHIKEAEALESEEALLKGVHGNLISPSDNHEES